MDKPNEWQLKIGEISARGWNFTQIATAIGRHPAYVTRLRNGEIKDPPASTADRLRGLHRSVVVSGDPA